MNYHRFLEILTGNFLLMTSTGSVIFILAAAFIMERISLAFDSEFKAGGRSGNSLIFFSRQSLSRLELKQLLVNLEKEKRALAFDRSFTTKASRESSQERIREIEVRLADVRVLLARASIELFSD